MFAGDGAHNSAEKLPEMINEGIRVLIYAGVSTTSFTTLNTPR